MKRNQLIIPAVFCLPLLGGCALIQSSDNKAVEPPTRVAGTADSPESLYHLGRYYQGQNRHEQAIAAYTQALQADSRFPKARNGLGVIFSLQGRYDEAIQAFEQAIREAPDDAYIYSNLGYAYYLKGLDAQAISTLERAISLDSGNARAKNNLGLAYARMGKKLNPASTLAGGAEIQHRGSPSGQAPKDSSSAITALATQNPVAITAQEVQVARPDAAVIVERVPKDVPVARSRVELVQSGLNVFELKARVEEALPVQDPVAHMVSVSLVAPANLTARIEVSNGNGVSGMAKVAGEFLRDKGFKATRLTNQKSFVQEVTRIEYRAGFLEEAERLRATLPGEMTLVETKDLRKDISVRLVLGKDIARSVSLFDANSRKTRLARSWQMS